MTCAAAFAVLLSACAAERAASPGADVRDPAALAAPPARARPSLLVPAAPPDSVPRAYYRDENVIESAPCTQGPLLSNILVVSFEPGSSRAERSAAVAAVGGAVVGGRPLSGFYLVLVPDDGTGAGLCDAESRLRASPAVTLAVPVMIGAQNPLEAMDGPVNPR